MSKKRLYSKREVSLIVQDRVKRLNERIEELELELSILRAEKEAEIENGSGEANNGN